LEQKHICIHQQQQEEKERDMLTKALEMSLRLEQETEERERLELEKVLALSEKETIGGYLEEEQEEDFVFLQVLESSKREHHGQPEIMDFEEQLKLALEESVLSL
jgi:transcription initiation factor IIF auxiliary subunit